MSKEVRIKQVPRYLINLVREISKASMAPAAFQRSYAWGKKDVLDLCDSIVLGYPVGSFFVWEAKKEDAQGRIKPRLGPVPLGGSLSEVYGGINIILDGHNRLCTMAWLLRDGSEPLPEVLRQEIAGQESLVWASEKRLVAYDLAANKFDFYSESEINKGFLIPSWILLGDRSINPFLRQQLNGPWSSLPDEQQENFVCLIDKLRERFNDSMVTLTVLEQASPATAKEAFLKICKVGVPMSEDDFILSNSWND